MKRIPAQKLTLTLSVIATVMLAAAVLVWGSEYKCSLYHRHPEKHTRVPIAKLLSERERPAAENPASSLCAPLLQVAFLALGIPLLALFGTVRPGFERIISAAQNIARISRPRCLIHFFFRPPPVMTP